MVPQKRHSDERPYKCDHDQCPKGFQDPNTLKSHKFTHKSEKNFKCDDCDKLFKHPELKEIAHFQEAGIGGCPFIA